MIQGPIAPLAAAFEMDAVERALRSGGEREAAKRSEEDAGTIAGRSWRWFCSKINPLVSLAADDCKHKTTCLATPNTPPTPHLTPWPPPHPPGTNNPALRYWMRSIREGGYMVISYAAQGVGAPLWYNQGLAATVPQVRGRWQCLLAVAAFACCGLS
jgi:hypothetical protein